jgi:hypothetical protein
MEAILINIVVGLVSGIVCSVATYMLYPKIVKQIQRTVADLKTIA